MQTLLFVYVDDASAPLWWYQVVGVAALERVHNIKPTLTVDCLFKYYLNLGRNVEATCPVIDTCPHEKRQKMYESLMYRYV